MGDITTVNGIVISATPIGEYDKRIVILTKERGKISAFAKGARRMNSSLMGVTQPFAFGSFQVFEGRTSYNVQQASISNYFASVISDLEAVCYACYFAEIADYFGKENLDASQSINLLYMALRALDNKNIPKELVRYIYELKTFVLNGEYPQVFHCSNCGSEENLRVFSLTSYGTMCSDCKTIAKDAIEITQSTVYTLQYIVTTGIDKLFTFNVSDEVMAELRMIMGRVCSHVIEKPMKSLGMLSIYF